MSRIRAETKLESDFLKKLSPIVYPIGYRYKKHYGKLPGRPDIVFPKQRLAIFLDGSFWHGKDLKQLKEKRIDPFWIHKIEENRKRDQKQKSLLKKKDWTVLRFWEEEIKGNPDKVIAKIVSTLKQNRKLYARK